MRRYWARVRCRIRIARLGTRARTYPGRGAGERRHAVTGVVAGVVGPLVPRGEIADGSIRGREVAGGPRWAGRRHGSRVALHGRDPTDRDLDHTRARAVEIALLAVDPGVAVVVIAAQLQALATHVGIDADEAPLAVVGALGSTASVKRAGLIELAAGRSEGHAPDLGKGRPTVLGEVFSRALEPWAAPGVAHRIAYSRLGHAYRGHWRLVRGRARARPVRGIGIGTSTVGGCVGAAPRVRAGPEEAQPGDTGESVWTQQGAGRTAQSSRQDGGLVAPGERCRPEQEHRRERKRVAACAAPMIRRRSRSAKDVQGLYLG
jgi:hypothetical protein